MPPTRRVAKSRYRATCRQVYQDALIKYIRLTDTPITIALQGEWGSGKTSLMNQLRYHLCDVDNAPYFPIWINTWQYSLMKPPAQAIISILEGIIGQIGALNSPPQHWEESKRKIGSLFKKMASVGTKVAAGAVGSHQPQGLRRTAHQAGLQPRHQQLQVPRRGLHQEDPAGQRFGIVLRIGAPRLHLRGVEGGLLLQFPHDRGHTRPLHSAPSPFRLTGQPHTGQPHTGQPHTGQPHNGRF